VLGEEVPVRTAISLPVHDKLAEIVGLAQYIPQTLIGVYIRRAPHLG